VRDLSGQTDKAPKRIKYSRVNSEIVQFKRIPLHFKTKIAYLLVVKNLTAKYRKIELEN